MKENSIEEGIKILENFINWLKTDFEYNSGEEIKAIEHILSDYKRVLKENGILKEEKEQAWEEWNNLEQGSYETEQKLKQQIKESQKENEELKKRFRRYGDVDLVTLAQIKEIEETVPQIYMDKKTYENLLKEE